MLTGLSPWFALPFDWRESGLVEMDADLSLALDQIDLGRLRQTARTLPGSTADIMAGPLLALLTGPAIAGRTEC